MFQALNRERAESGTMTTNDKKPHTFNAPYTPYEHTYLRILSPTNKIIQQQQPNLSHERERQSQQNTTKHTSHVTLNCQFTFHSPVYSIVPIPKQHEE